MTTAAWIIVGKIVTVILGSIIAVRLLIVWPLDLIQETFFCQVSYVESPTSFTNSHADDWRHCKENHLFFPLHLFTD